MPFIYKLFISKKPICQKKIVNKMSIFKFQTSNFAITRSADDVPWTLNIKRDKRDPFLIF